MHNCAGGGSTMSKGFRRTRRPWIPSPVRLDYRRCRRPKPQLAAVYDRAHHHMRLLVHRGCIVPHTQWLWLGLSPTSGQTCCRREMQRVVTRPTSSSGQAGQAVPSRNVFRFSNKVNTRRIWQERGQGKKCVPPGKLNVRHTL